MSAFSCKKCWPKLCTCTSPAAKAYLEWAAAGFWFEGTVMRRDDGLLIQICEDGKAYLLEQFMPEEECPVTVVDARQMSLGVDRG